MMTKKTFEVVTGTFNIKREEATNPLARSMSEGPCYLLACRLKGRAAGAGASSPHLTKWRPEFAPMLTETGGV
jgi:hypothetical protein